MSWSNDEVSSTTSSTIVKCTPRTGVPDHVLGRNLPLRQTWDEFPLTPSISHGRKDGSRLVQYSTVGVFVFTRRRTKVCLIDIVGGKERGAGSATSAWCATLAPQYLLSQTRSADTVHPDSNTRRASFFRTNSAALLVPTQYNQTKHGTPLLGGVYYENQRMEYCRLGSMMQSLHSVWREEGVTSHVSPTIILQVYERMFLFYVSCEFVAFKFPGAEG